MTTIKSYTDLEQSEKLMEFLPLESADSHYVRQTHDFRGNTVDGKWSHPKYGNPNSRYANYIIQNFSSYETIPCWSLAALLELIPNYQLQTQDDGIGILFGHKKGFEEATAECPLDACVVMIEKLHKQKLL